MRKYCPENLSIKAIIRWNYHYMHHIIQYHFQEVCQSTLSQIRRGFDDHALYNREPFEVSNLSNQKTCTNDTTTNQTEQRKVGQVIRLKIYPKKKQQCTTDTNILFKTSIKTLPPRLHLTVSSQRQGVAFFPVRTSRRTLNFIRFVSTLTQSSGLTSGTREATFLTSFVRGVHNPINSGITTNDLVRMINENDFKIFVRRVLVDPIRIEEAKIRESRTSTFLGHRSQVTTEFQLVNTVMLGFTIHNAFSIWAFATTTTNGHAHDDIALFGFEPETTGFVRSGRTMETMDGGELSVFPSTNTEEKSQHVRLFLLPKFF